MTNNDAASQRESVCISGADNVERARWLAVRSALKLEMAGFTHSGSRRSARQLANAITGQKCATRAIAYDFLDAFITKNLGPEFARPRTN